MSKEKFERTKPHVNVTTKLNTKINFVLNDRLEMPRYNGAGDGDRTHIISLEG